MFAVTFQSLCWTLLSVSLVGFTCAPQKNIKAESGQDVTLTCGALNIDICVKWSRADLYGEYVLLYRDEVFVPDDQHPSFKNRVDLQDRQMEDGDVSLILKNVTINDAGTYECRVFMGETRSWKSISVITLSVVDPPARPRGAKDVGDGVRRHGGLIASVLLLMFAVAAAVVISKKQKTDPPSEEKAKKEMV